MNRIATNIGRRFYSSHSTPAIKNFTIADVHSKYKLGIPLTMCTAYDYITANWVQQAQCDMLLVGDSLAMTSLGYDSTTDLPFDEFKYHVKSVARAPGPSLIVADMPFGTFEQSHEYGIANAIDLMKLSSRVTSVKVEVGPHTKDKYTLDFVRKLCERGIPVMAHIGLTPQRANSLGGFKVQGNKSSTEIVELYETAQLLQRAGCWSSVIECIPQKAATFITENIEIPTIGIGAGNGTSGQVLVIADMLGMQNGKVPKFVKKYGEIDDAVNDSLERYVEEVESRSFPSTADHTFKIKDSIWNEFIERVKLQEQ